MRTTVDIDYSLPADNPMRKINRLGRSGQYYAWTPTDRSDRSVKRIAEHGHWRDRQFIAAFFQVPEVARK
jgi:hypothetical protein